MCQFTIHILVKWQQLAEEQRDLFIWITRHWQSAYVWQKMDERTNSRTTPLRDDGGTDDLKLSWQVAEIILRLIPFTLEWTDQQMNAWNHSYTSQGPEITWASDRHVSCHVTHDNAMLVWVFIMTCNYCHPTCEKPEEVTSKLHVRPFPLSEVWSSTEVNVSEVYVCIMPFTTVPARVSLLW